MASRRYELSDFEWSIIEPLLPNKPRGVPRADDRKVLNGIYWRLRTGSPWADIPERYGPATTCYNRFVRWRKLGVWDRIFAAVSAAYARSEEHTSELQSLMRRSYAVFCLKKKRKIQKQQKINKTNKHKQNKTNKIYENNKRLTKQKHIG